MTEQEWLDSTDPAAMLAALNTWHVGTGPMQQRICPLFESGRKLRLFAVVCCRAVFHLLADERSRRAVEVAERYADGKVTSGELAVAHWDAHLAWQYMPDDDRRAVAMAALADEASGEHAASAARFATVAAGPFPDVLNTPLVAHTMRDIVGNPWRPVTCDPAWLTQTVVALAQTAYDERPGLECPCMRGDNPRHEWTGIMPALWQTCTRCHGHGTVADGRLDPERLLVLADALEEAGCPMEVKETCRGCGGAGVIEDEVGSTYACVVCSPGGNWAGTGKQKVPHPLLAHLRSLGPHYRGCWALDLILGKE